MSLATWLTLTAVPLFRCAKKLRMVGKYSKTGEPVESLLTAA